MIAGYNIVHNFIFNVFIVLTRSLGIKALFLQILTKRRNNKWLKDGYKNIFIIFHCNDMVTDFLASMN